MAKLHLGDISGEFNVLTKKQTEQIIKLFDSVKKDLQKDLKGLGNTKSEKLQKLQVEDAINSLDKNIVEAYKHFEGQIDDSVKSIVDAVVQNEKGFYDSIGIKFNSSTTSIPINSKPFLITWHVASTNFNLVAFNTSSSKFNTECAL